MMLWARAWRLSILLMLLTGCLYPLLITGIGQGCFPWQANGSLLKQNEHYVGSRWIGQNFASDAYFFGRPSATYQEPYNGLASGGSNLAVSNPSLIEDFKHRIAQRHLLQLPIPGDLVMASGSGLDPEISPEAAYYQEDRIAKTRNLSQTQVHALIQKHVQNRSLAFLGEPRVNVLKLNMALDELSIISR